jgi:membrane-associated phospholipid phosphatase
MRIEAQQFKLTAYARTLAATAIFMVVMVSLCGVPFEYYSLAPAMLVPVGCLLLAPFAGRTSEGLLALATLLTFASIYPIAMYAGATLDVPYADALLTKLDCGIAPAIYHLVKQWPAADSLLSTIYNTVFIQTLAVIIVLTWTRQSNRLRAFVMRFMLGCLMALVLFCLFPAEGTVAGGLPVPEGYDRIISELSRLRSSPTYLVQGMPEGLITFPSFHTIWAVLLTAAFHRTLIFKPLLVINTLMIVSTMSIGMHYFVDVVVGLGISAFVIAMTSLAPLAVRNPATAGPTCWQQAAAA